MKNLIVISIFYFISTVSFSQDKFKVLYLNNDYKTHYLANESNTIIKKLDSTYSIAYDPESFAHFKIFAIQGEKGWCAIDINEKILFKVFNTEIGTPSPDDLTNGLIRIEQDSLIGFANEMGEIVIQPKFEIATSFENGYAIIGKRCKKVPWDENHNEQGCNHYSIVCDQHGYIDLKGNIIEFGEFTFEEIAERIKKANNNSK
jgi:hypothetical protein